MTKAQLTKLTKQLMGKLPREPTDSIALWVKQNDTVWRDLDIDAYERLPSDLRRLIADAPIQIACIPLLYGCREWGAVKIELAFTGMLAEWMKWATRHEISR